MKKVHYRIETFALGNLGGGHWENDVLVSADTPEQAYAEALEYLGKQGYACEVTITNCRKNGENFT